MSRTGGVTSSALLCVRASARRHLQRRTQLHNEPPLIDEVGAGGGGDGEITEFTHTHTHIY